MRKPIFKGAGTAIVTPFREDGVNFEKLSELLEFQIQNGIDSIVICGTTGEASTMPDEEHVATVKYTVEKVNHRVPVIAGAGSNDTRHSVELGKKLEAVGADALLSVAPYYNKTTQRGLVAHFTAAAKQIKLPFILYNVPSRTNLNIAPDTLAELSKVENIVAVKECNLEQVGDLVAKCEKDFAIYSGEDSNILPLMSWGGLGVISVLSNIIPKDTRELCAKFLAGDIAGAREIQVNTMRLIRALFSEVNPIPVKEALNLMGFAVGPCRLPLVEIGEGSKKILKDALAAYGLIQ
ncbi:MAG: 4-hydroxy-tetrahydrodipicolinate synthase [Clostridiales bacterium]|jgi:4-hydroxy-tetrahydrodipicolinate synthase|nr:4-hydroxy-tetrahydrodipicolinate synthase [Clostridiales bacterium]